MMPGRENLAVNAGQDSRRYAGAFQISAEGISDVKAGQLEEAIDEVLDDLKTNIVSAEELQKVKNQMRVRTIRFMDMMSGLGILFMVGPNAAMGDWAETNNHPVKIDQVTAEDLRRVANVYFAADQRNVLIINPKAGADKEEAGGDSRAAQMVQMIKSMTEPAQVEQMINMVSMRMEGVEDPEGRARMEEMLKLACEHLESLKAAVKQ